MVIHVKRLAWWLANKKCSTNVNSYFRIHRIIEILWDFISVAPTLDFSIWFSWHSSWGMGLFRQRFGRSEARLQEPTWQPEVPPPIPKALGITSGIWLLTSKETVVSGLCQYLLESEYLVLSTPPLAVQASA